MKQFFASIAFLAVALPASAQWYTGGDLHRKTLYDWDRATDQNKLATAGDWYAAIAGEAKIRRMGGISSIKPKARQLVICLDEASRGLDASTTRSITTAETAAACLVLMGEN